MKYQGRNEEYFEVVAINSENNHLVGISNKSELSLLWFESDQSKMTIDSKSYTFKENDIICLTEFHKLESVAIHQARLLKFNRPFYCVLDHDSEVGCKGVLYYGASNVPILQPNETDLDILQTVWKMLCIEMVSKDNLQLEMLQMMLKRILILCTRIYKSQINYNLLESGNTDILREFNFLIEQHFREKHKVGDYATLLNKSPKSLSNLFKSIGAKTPLQFIQSRILLEARRLLRYTDKSISEIGYEIGFNDVQSFSRFFKNKEDIYPKDFRKNTEFTK